jgi:hypothetical protein
MTQRKAKKTQVRVTLIEGIVRILRSKKIYGVLRKNVDESTIKTFMYPILVDGMKGIYHILYPNYEPGTIQRKANRAVLWEGDKTVTISNTRLFGVQHRPDFVIRAEGVRIAIEIKRGEKGDVVREGLGQGLVYKSDYDFVIVLLRDTSKDKKIVDSLDNTAESELVNALWENYNIRFEVV